MSTDLCKSFLALYGSILGEPVNQTWKRVAKRSQAGKTIREFKNPQGRIVALSEQAGLVSIESVGAQVDAVDSDSDAFGVLSVGPSPSSKQVIDFLVACIAEDPSQVHPKALADALSPACWEAHFIETDADEHGNFPPAEELALPYEGQPEGMTYAQVSRVYELHMSDYDTAYRFAIYLGHDGRLYLGENNPD